MEGIDQQIESWLQRKYPVEMPYELTQSERATLEAKNQIFQSLISDFPVSLGKEASRKERETRNFGPISDSTLTYGEIDFTSIGEVFETIRSRFKCLPSQGVFYDLGSGTGKGVAAAALLCPFTECRGIELLEGLFSISASIKSKYDENVESLKSQHPDLFPSLGKVEFLCKDFFEYDWSDASLIFANSTCFDHEMMRKIGQVSLQPGTLGISFTKTIPGDNWIVLESIKKNMSWGEATVYIQRYVTTSDIERISSELQKLPIEPVEPEETLDR